jgi:mannosyltransferase
MRGPCVMKTAGNSVPVGARPSAGMLPLVLIVAAGAALRVWLLGLRSYWVDEAISVNLARLPFRAFLWNLWNYEGNMAFYYFLLRGWVHLGSNEATVRGLSVIFGVATILALYVLATRLFDRRVGLISAGLLALHSFHIRYSQEARSYSLLVLLLVLSTYVFVLAVESPNRKGCWVLYAVLAALAFYCHLFALLVLATHWLSLGPAGLRRIGARRVLFAVAVLAFLIAPMVAFVLLKSAGQLDWVPKPTVESMRFFVNYMGAYAGPALFCGYLLFSLLAPRWRPRPGSSARASEERDWGIRLLYLWFAFPIALTFAVSFYRPVFSFRYMVICLPPLVLLAALGIAALANLFPQRPWLVSSALSLMIAGSILGIFNYYRAYASYDNGWRGATERILSAQQPGDALIIDDSASPVPYEFYLRQEWTANHIQFSPTRLAVLHAEKPAGLKPTSEEMTQATAGFRRIWFAQQGGDPERSAAPRSFIPAEFSERFQEVVPGVESTPVILTLYDRSDVETGSLRSSDASQ